MCLCVWIPDLASQDFFPWTESKKIRTLYDDDDEDDKSIMALYCIHSVQKNMKCEKMYLFMHDIMKWNDYGESLSSSSRKEH